ncbi:MAG: cyclophilin-like fold protein [Phascolarctobacterium sp.]|nr:cyclophilin-like fold protein [Phascolarctobacterium sp.]
MKKSLLIMTILLLTICCVGCGSASKSEAKQEKQAAPTQTNAQAQGQSIYADVGKKIIKIDLTGNSSSAALLKMLETKNVTIDMHDFGNFEKVGELGFTLPRNDEEISTDQGDVILYQGSRFVIYYDKNQWNFTRLGRVSKEDNHDLKGLFGPGNITCTLITQNRLEEYKKTKGNKK